MNRKSSLLIIFLVFALPVMLFYVLKAPKEGISASALAEAAGKPKVLHFSQTMCSECRKLEGILPAVKEEYKDKVVFVDIDVANGTPETNALMQKYSVRVVPTMVFINKSGKTVARTEGAIPKEEIERYLDSILK